jgi:formamidopyrimidine-DNA glycosylase
MIELPEAGVLADQLRKTAVGKTVIGVTAAQNPHKWAWFNGNPDEYRDLLRGKTLKSTGSRGGFVELLFEDTTLLFSEGINLLFHQDKTTVPKKHQLLLQFAGGGFLTASVQMYGGLWAFTGSFDNPYYQSAQDKPSPFDTGFDFSYFTSLFSQIGEKASLKAFLATEQRIPGLGNGVLQDILFNAGMHPKKKTGSLTGAERRSLFESLISTLKEMRKKEGRDTETDLFGNPGGYRCIVSKKTLNGPCPGCGSLIEKASYMGGSIYFCPRCQKK